MWHYRAALAVIALDHANYEDDENSFIVASEEERYNATTQYMRTSTSLSTCSMAWPRRTSCTSNTLWSSTHGRAANDSFNGHDAARVCSLRRRRFGRRPALSSRAALAPTLARTSAGRLRPLCPVSRWTLPPPTPYHGRLSPHHARRLMIRVPPMQPRANW